MAKVVSNGMCGSIVDEAEISSVVGKENQSVPAKTYAATCWHARQLNARTADRK